MKWEKGTIFDLCYINPENISRNYPHDVIRYFDISSVGSGVVSINDEIPLSEAPSRAKRVVRNDDTILATVRPGNRSFYFFKSAFENSIASTGFAVLRPKVDKTDPRFLYYLVSEQGFTSYLVAYEQGANYPAVNPDIIGGKPIVFPPLPTQRKIASILSAYDDLIENNMKRIKLLEEKAQLHYKELILDSTKWDKIRLEEFVSVVKGRKPANVIEHPEDESQLYLLLDTVERGKTLYTTDLSLPQSKITDVLMCMDGARSGLSFRGMVGAIGSTMAIWRSNSERVSGEYLYQFMKQNESAITQGNTGAAIPHANRKFILDMKMLIPPKKEAEFFDSLTQPIINLINTLHNQNTKLREARDILLPRLMSGEIEV